MREAESTKPTLAPEEGGPLASVGTSGAFPVEHWERYELLALLGRGGMGEVYEARDRRLGRSVALKFLRGADPDRVMRLLQEARAQARIHHPGICEVYEVGDVAGRAYIAMQRVGGERLDRAARAMSLPEKVQVMRAVAEALHEAHRLGVIHRDLKPSNILVERGPDGRRLPVLVDFGLAYEVQQGHGLTETGALMGTPAYMSPEQARGDVQSIDRRSDVYGLGATLYELLTGVAPFTEATAVGTLAKVLHEEPLRPRSHVPGLPRELETVALKCLSKEPDRRYPSARALAEDLGRYIDGEPILGQRPELSYRLRRWARRHRPLVTVSVLSLVSLLFVAGLGVRSEWEARRAQEQSEARARLAERLGQQVKEAEWFLRVAHMLPLHDTEPERKQVRARIDAMAAQPHPPGGAEEALVHYAVGRGSLAMLDFERAHAELMRARQLGLDSPELHAALGRVLGELYHRALEDARRSGGPEWLAARQRELERQYLEPALQALERSQGAELEAPRYLEGLIAFYRRDPDAAARAAAQAVVETPWLYEARKLAGDVASARAMERLERGEYDGARAGFQEAGRLYAEAESLGPSDARNTEALAEAWHQLAEIDRRQGRPRKESLERALEASSRALRAAPLRASGHTRRAFILMDWYRLMRFQVGGADPKSILQEWIATAARAGKLEPRNASACDTLGYSHFMRGMQAARDGEDPAPAWDEAIRWLTQALVLQPRYPWALNDLALVYRWKGNHQREHGQEPRQAYAEAERFFLRAAEMDPKYLFAFSNLGDLYNAMAEEALSRGRSPETEVQKALQVSRQALALDGRYYAALNQWALAELTRARYLFESGSDPRPALERAHQQLEASHAINSSFGRTSLLRAMGQHLAALHALREEGGDPRAAFEAGRTALVEAVRLDAGCVDCRVVSARMGLTEAEWAKRRGRAPLPLFQQALADARRAVEMYPYAEAHQELARVYLALADAQPSGDTVEQGLAQVEKALQLQPDLAHAYAIQGRLLRLRARTEQGTRASQTLRQARAALARATELNPLLVREYASCLSEVESLLSRAR